MIEDKKDKVKIAENPIEALWANALKASEQRLQGLKDTLIVEEAFLEMCKEKQKV